MTHARKLHLGKRVPISKYQHIRTRPDPPEPLPECHPCHGCSAVDLSSHRLYCFLPVCLREDLEKTL